MNEDMFKQTLLEIIKEANNLDNSELEVIPKTRIFVKKGRVDEFKANARFYYQAKYNVIVNNEDYLKDVYYELSDEIAHELGEHTLSLAYEIYEANKGELARLDALNKSIYINHQDREKYNKALSELNSKNISPSSWEEITSLQNSIKTLSDNEIIIRNAIAEIKTKVNDKVKESLLDEMEFLRQSYLNTRFGTKTEFGLDGSSILAKDKETYDNLYILLRIIENVNEKDNIVSVDNTLCVNPHQVDAVKELLPKLPFLHLVKEPEKKEESPLKKQNDELIKQISASLSTTQKSNGEEYENLIKILRYLNKANNSKYDLVPVWDIAYVLGEDRNAVQDLFKKTSFFQKYNPDLEKIAENEKLIVKLQNYLTELENKFKNYQGLTNIPVAKVGDAIILSEDKLEYENVLAIIDILKNSKDNLIHISESGNVSYADMPKYKELLSKTKYFTPNLLSAQIEEKNKPILREIEDELTDLIKRAKNSPNEALAEGKEILISDLPIYDALSKKYEILKEAEKTPDVIEVNGALVPSSRAKEYQALTVAPSKKQENLDEVEVLDNSQEPTDKPIDKPVSEQTAFETKEDTPPVLMESEEPSKPEEKPKEPLKRRIVKSIRKAKNKEWWKKNWKKVAVIGLASIVLLYALSTLAPAIVYANSCLAMSSPALSGVLGTINSTIIEFFGLSLGELNLNVAASHAFSSLAMAAANLGLVGVSAAAIVKTIKKDKPNRLKDPNRITASKSILNLKDRILEKSKDLARTFTNKATEFTSNLAQAVDSNAIRNQELTSLQIEAEPLMQSEDDLEKEQVIEQNVEKQIEEEKKKIIEDRINERFSRIKHAEDAEYIRPTTLSDEPIIKGPASEVIPVTVTIPTDDEILSTISDKSLQIARTDNYIDAIKDGDTKKAHEYQKLVFDETGIDLSKYDMNNDEEIVQARSDVANFMNQIDISKRSR